MTNAEKILEIRELELKEKKVNHGLEDFLNEQRCLPLLLKQDYNKWKNKRYLQYMKTKIYLIEIEKVLEKLKSVDYAIFKGFIYSKHAYNDISMRMFGDIDLLVDISDITRIKNVLLNLGYDEQYRNVDGIWEKYSRQNILFYQMMTHQLAPFSKTLESNICSNICLDVNHQLMWGESKKKINMRKFLSHTKIEVIEGIPIKVLLPVYELVAVCLHLYKDMNSIVMLYNKGNLWLTPLYDLYRWLENNKLSYYDLKNVCEEFLVTEYVYFCCYHVFLLFESEPAKKILGILENDKGINLIRQYGLQDSEKKEWKVCFEARLFDQEFKKHFYEMLNQNEKKQIKINSLYL